jgi:hypothetical protein
MYSAAVSGRPLSILEVTRMVVPGNTKRSGGDITRSPSIDREEISRVEDVSEKVSV